MTNLLQASFSHTYAGQESFDILNNAFQSQYSILGDWRVITDVVSKRNLYLSEGKNKLLKPYSNTWQANSNRIPLSDRVISVEDMEINLNLSRDEIKDTAWEEITKSGADRDNLSDTPIMDFITQQIQTGLHNDVLRMIMFNSTSASSDDYNAFDGLLKALITTSGVVRPTFGTDISIDASGGGLITDAALNTFRHLIEHCDNKLQVKPLDEKAIYCTPDLYFNFLQTLETGAHDYAKIILQNGEVRYKFRGIEIIPVWSWATDVADTDNAIASSLTSVAKSLAIYTEKKNLVVGTDIGVAGYTINMEYIMYLKQM